MWGIPSTIIFPIRLGTTSRNGDWNRHGLGIIEDQHRNRRLNLAIPSTYLCIGSRLHSNQIAKSELARSLVVDNRRTGFGPTRHIAIKRFKQ
jgi:hypothetical protein